MEIIANDLPLFDRDIQDYQEARELLISGTEALFTDMEQLGTMWQGEAHDQLMATFSVDRKRTEEMLEQLNRLLEDLKFALAEYTKCENSVAGIIEEIEV